MAEPSIHAAAVTGFARAADAYERVEVVAIVDAVTVAQAFHWFDASRALPEIHRVLRPGGVLALVWNRRRMEDEIHRGIQTLLDPRAESLAQIRALAGGGIATLRCRTELELWRRIP